MSQPASSPTPKISGSQKRQRAKSIKIALTEAEYQAAMQKVAPSGLSPSSYGRAVLLGDPGPRAQRTPHVNAVELAKATVQLNKAGNNLNQIAHVLNASGSIAIGECLAALAETRAALAAILEIVGRNRRI